MRDAQAKPNKRPREWPSASLAPLASHADFPHSFALSLTHHFPTVVLLDLPKPQFHCDLGKYYSNYTIENTCSGGIPEA